MVARGRGGAEKGTKRWQKSKKSGAAGSLAEQIVL